MKKLLILVLLVSLTGLNTASAVVNKKGTKPMKKITQTAERTQLGNFAPEFAHFNDVFCLTKIGIIKISVLKQEVSLQ